MVAKIFVNELRRTSDGIGFSYDYANAEKL